MCKDMVDKVSGTVLLSEVEDRLCWVNDKCRKVDGVMDYIALCNNVKMAESKKSLWKEDKAGFGGVLRDMEGIAKGIFSGAVHINVVEEAEIGAVKIALEFFLSMNWKTNDSLFIELGSTVAFSWCINKFLRPWSFHAIFSKIENVKLKVRSVVFSLTDWNGNDMAFSLALASVKRSQVFKVWW
ncbi:hypothetical protein PVK06_018172 [Gossypium arboreum]|uniref:RNase H type-1 domain-containing protein n=1 Tax=Gossypium arboreum TaxID=29729 RepID=A0ABR0Q4N2_GOSAR|nr:hypothetical protein PVK06_018172 [Gossypium arboreum]